MNTINIEELQALFRSQGEKIKDQINENRARLLEEGEVGPVAKMLEDDVSLGLMLLVFVEFVHQRPTAATTQFNMLASGEVQFQIPIPELFHTYADRRLALLAQGINTMEGQSIVVNAPVNVNHALAAGILATMDRDDDFLGDELGATQ